MNARFKWNNGVFSDEALVDFFVSNVNADYVSHGEVISLRADLAFQWRDDLKKTLLKELSGIRVDYETEKHTRIAVAVSEDDLIGLAIVFIDQDNQHAAVEDIVMDDAVRGHGLGSAFMQWIEDELSKINIRLILLESGINNPAHAFFEKLGYRTVSKAFAKDIGEKSS
jgi:GNAT superfamily N-acetyltransferase